MTFYAKTLPEAEAAAAGFRSQGWIVTAIVLVTFRGSYFKGQWCVMYH